LSKTSFNCASGFRARTWPPNLRFMELKMRASPSALQALRSVLALVKIDQRARCVDGSRAMPIITNLYEAKTSLSSLVDRAAAGEEFIIAKNGVPMARLVPLQSKGARRRPGGWEGQVWTAEDFDAPLPEDILAGFEGDG
jgi:prevent-host-death family protein